MLSAGQAFCWEHMPEEIKTHTLSYLDIQSLAKAAPVCKNISTITASDEIWKRQFYRAYPNAHESLQSCNLFHGAVSWRERYKTMDSMLFDKRLAFTHTGSLCGHTKSISAIVRPPLQVSLAGLPEDHSTEHILYSCGYDGHVIMWSLKKNKPLLSKRIATYRQTLGMEFVTPARAFQSEHSPLENVLVVSDNEGYMHVLSPVTLESFAMWKIHSLYSWCVRHIPRHAPSGDMADRMISASGDETIIIWDLHTGKVLVREKGAGSILSIELVPSLNLVYAGSSAGIITAYSMTDLTSLGSWKPHTSTVRQIKVVDSKALVAISDDASISLSDYKKQDRIEQLSNPGTGVTLAIDHFGRAVVYAGTGPSVVILDAQGTVAHSLPGSNVLAVLLTGDTLYMGLSGGDIKVWKLGPK